MIKIKPIYGMLLMVLAMIVFSGVNLFVKDVAERYSVVQIVFFRCAFMMPPVMFALLRSKTRTFKSFQMKRHIMCGTVGFVGLFCLYYSLRTLPLAEVTTLCFTSIFFVTLFAALLLKEHVNFHQWFAVLAGFIGILIIAQPNSSLPFSGIMTALCFSVIDALIMINARILTRNDSSYLVVLYFSLFSSLSALIFLPFEWSTPTAPDLVKLMTLGIAGGIGQILITKAYEKAPAAFVAPMIYTAILWSILFGMIFFGEMPNLRLLIGCSVNVSA
ncbi:MAG: DMT family transporter, partial [Alphaproteobacteria bacterium]|nr:DMT family transporter [Alphaproteobacteria bacterium]